MNVPTYPLRVNSLTLSATSGLPVNCTHAPGTPSGTQEMFPLDPIAAGAAFFRGGLLDGGLDLLHFGIVHFAEVHRVPFDTGQDDGLDKLRIGGHHTAALSHWSYF